MIISHLDSIILYIYNTVYQYIYILYKYILFFKNHGIFYLHLPAPGCASETFCFHMFFTFGVCWDGASHAHEALERNFGGLKKEESWYGWWGDIVFFGMLKVGLFQKLHFSVGKHDDQPWSFRLPHFQTNPSH